MPPAIIDRIFAADAARDLDGFMALLSEPARLRVGSAPPQVGQAAIRQAIAGLFAAVAGIEHRLIHQWRDEAALAYEAEVRFTRHDGGTVTLPYVNVLRFDAAGAIDDYRIHIDLAPLFAPPGGATP